MKSKKIKNAIFWLSTIVFWLIVGCTETPTVIEKIMIIVIQAEAFGLCFKWKKQQMDTGSIYCFVGI